MCRWQCFALVLVSLVGGCAGADDGDDFSNNLFSDLAPILALFGERVTMQFLSQSMGWADCILLAMAPLGIVTTIVSAIRVGGPPWLKAIIGRSRENLSAAEMELMSSTSHEACELWNGKDVVRCLGSPSIREFICVFPAKMDGMNMDSYKKVRVMQLKDTLGQDFEKLPIKENGSKRDRDDGGVAEPRDSRRSPPPDEEQGTFHPTQQRPESAPPGHSETRGGEGKEEDESWITIARNTDVAAPNITLNRPENASRRELRVIAAIGIVLQVSVVLLFGFITYYPTSRFEKDGKAVVRHAFPLTAGGTLLLVLGMLMCSHVVDSSTDETRYKVVGGKKVQVVWLQTESKVSDQVFSPVAIHRRKPCKMVTTSNRVVKDSHDRDSSGQPAGEDMENSARSTAFSRENNAKRRTLRSRLRRAPQDPITEKPSESPLATTAAPKESRRIAIEVKTLIGTAICLVGFIVQFVGLRSMHWSASITQLAAVIVMAILRTWVRRGFTSPLDTQDLTSGHEMDWFVLTLADLQGAPWCKGVIFPETNRSPTGPIHMSELSNNLRHFLIGDNSQSRVQEAVGSWIVDYIQDSKTTITRSSRVDSTGDSYLETSDRRTAQGVLRLRADLGSLAGWRGPASAEAIRLSAAMEIVLNTMYPRNPTPKNLVPHAHYTWSIEVGYIKSSGAAPERQMVNFRLTRDAPGQTWKVRTEEIDAALSLWLYSTRKTHNDNGLFRFPPVDGNWLRGRGLRPAKAYRKLGSYTYRLAQDLGWWMPGEQFDILRCNAVTEKGGNDSTITGYIQGKDLAKWNSFPRHGVGDELWLPEKFPNQTLSNWWDSSAASSFYDSSYDVSTYSDASSTSSDLDGSEHTDADPQSTSGLNETDHASADSQGTFDSGNVSSTEEVEENSYYPWYPKHYPDSDLDNLDYGVDDSSDDEEVEDGELDDGEVEAELDDDGVEDEPPEGPGNEFPILAVESHNTLEKSYTRVLFSAFMWAVAKKRKRQFTSHADIQMTREGMREYDSWKYFTLQSSQLSKLAQDIHSTGHQSLREVYLSIIPPFSFHDRLPRLDGVVERACEQGKREERLMRWKEAADVYGWLLRMAFRYPPGSFIYRNALAISIQYLEERTSNLAISEFYDPETFFNYCYNMPTVQKKEEDGLRRLLATQKRTVRLQKLRDLRRPRAILHRAELHCLAGRGDWAGVSRLLQSGSSPGVVDIRDLTPLHYACQHGHEDVAEVLLIHGASVDAQGLDGSSPLHLAALYGHDKVAAMLTRRYASTSLRDSYGRLAIHCAAMNGHLNLVDRFKADAGSPDRRGRTALHYAAWFGQVDVIVRLLGPSGSSGLSIADSGKFTPLHFAAWRGHDEVVRSFINAGDNLHARCNFQDWTPLHLAACKMRKDVIALIIAEDPSLLYITDSEHRTPLRVAKHSMNNDHYILMVEEKKHTDVYDLLTPSADPPDTVFQD